MKEILLEIIDSEIMYYVVVPFVLMLLGWIKNAHDIKEKNKELGYWMIKHRKMPTFADIAMKLYKALAINLVIVQIAILFVELWKGLLFAYIMCGIVYFGVGALCVILIWKEKNTKVEFMTHGKNKKVLLIFLYLIYALPFFFELYGKYTVIVDFLFAILLSIWMYYLYKYSDIVLVWDNIYADIYINGSEKAEFAEVGSLKKHGEWILVNRHINGCEEEIRIKESDIVRIDYYGGPAYVVLQCRLFGKK